MTGDPLIDRDEGNGFDVTGFVSRSKEAGLRICGSGCARWRALTWFRTGDDRAGAVITLGGDCTIVPRNSLPPPPEITREHRGTRINRAPGQ